MNYEQIKNPALFCLVFHLKCSFILKLGQINFELLNVIKKCLYINLYHNFYIKIKYTHGVRN